MSEEVPASGFQKDILKTGNQKERDTPQSTITFGTKVQAGGGSAGEMPFWLHSNRFGSLDRYSQNSSMHLFGSWEETILNRLALSVHFDLLLREARQSEAWFQEAYIQAEYAGFLLFAGRKIEHYGWVHPMLSSGTMDLSYNARPMPKIAFSTKDFRPVPFTGRVFYYDASLAHGWFDDHPYRFMDGVLLHQKHLYLRMFSEDAPISPRAGLKHFAQWGGRSDVIGKNPIGLRTYMDVFFSLASDSKEIFEGGETENIFQNHFGTYDFALMLNLNHYRVALSRQFILEDTPNARFGTPWDGMWGAYIERRPDPRTRWRSERPKEWRTEHRPLIKAIHYEYIDTKEGIHRFPHRDKITYFNYYNHWAYQGGWTYRGRVLGNPLFIGDPDYYGVVNNILIGHHTGIMGYAGPVGYRFFATYTRNYGAGHIYQRMDEDFVYHRPDQKRFTGVTGRFDQWSFMVELQTHLFSGNRNHSQAPKREANALNFAETKQNGHSSRWFDPRNRMIPIKMTLSLGYDRGDLLPHNFGILIGFRWESKSRR